MLLLLLGATSALSPFGMVLLAPALASIGAQFDVDSARTQYLISAYLVGLAVAQPLAGILCDRFGRRPVLLIGFGGFVVASLVCAFVDEFGWLIAMRFVQAVCASVGTVASRAVVRDMHDGDGSARALSYIAAAMGVTPIVGSSVGGFVADAWGGQSVFLVAAMLGALIWVWSVLRYPETIDAAAQEQPSLRQWADSYRQLLGSGAFLGYSMMYGFSQGLFLAFMAVGAAVFQHDLGLSASAFGLGWGVLAFAYVVGAMFNARVAHRVGHRRMLKWSLLTCVAGAWLLPAMVSLAGVSLTTLFMPLALLSCANGAITPLALAGAVSCRPLIAGSSSGLSSAIGLSLSGVFTIVAGVVYQGDFLPVALVMAITGTLAGATYLLVRD